MNRRPMRPRDTSRACALSAAVTLLEPRVRPVLLMSRNARGDSKRRSILPGANGLGPRSELSDQLHIAPRSTTEVVDSLESRGLIQRRPDPADRRATLVELTEHGASLLEVIRAAR